MYSVGVAYLLWFFLGVAGAHRFYLGRIGSGLFFFFTGGGFFIGWLTDLFRIPSMVRESNLLLRAREVLSVDTSAGIARAAAKETLERTVLRTARSNAGTVTPAQVALEGDWTLEQAEKALEKLASGGHAEMRIRESGVIEYHFAEFERER